MSELKKLETTGYSSKLDEIAKNDTEVFLKVKLSGRRTFGEYEFEPKNGFAVHFGNHIDVLDLDKCDVYQLDQPQLNPNQQIVLDYLKEKCNLYSFIAYKPFEAIIRLSMLDPEKNELRVKNTIDELTYVQQAQVLEVFSRWALEQEAE